MSDGRFVVLEHHDPGQVRRIARQVAGSNPSVLTAGWQVPPDHSAGDVVCVGRVVDTDDAARAVLAAVAGADLVIDAGSADRDVIDRLCDDLRRLGVLDHRVEPPPAIPLDDVQQDLLGLLMAGATLGQAARVLHLSRRTADRRLAASRQALNVDSTTEAVTAARRLGVEPIDFRSRPDS
ncbi:hypothetical protein [Jatrophihabitans endophyticus]|uniref:helix-turn-helix transcriptional regulator n=1 Tax=Jatrophihabitans endophyticus TaxID=1206085 RepID=UPI0019E58B96|nr:hypothetical protein [Jatrophihabitans endophyticus]MBE7188453.1 hypothetical protein [Jatrophihabitans endophyticus]